MRSRLGSSATSGMMAEASQNRTELVSAAVHAVFAQRFCEP
jgi:hypothetical protein